jgi:thiol-disulfide isomerase/thioredoxin
VVLVNFWATWCPPCVAEMPAMQQLQEKLGASVFQILAVNYGESREKAADFARRMDLGFPILLDAFHLVRRDWKVRVLPASYLIDRSGNIRYTALGEVDWSSAPVVATVRGLIDIRKG